MEQSSAQNLSTWNEARSVASDIVTAGESGSDYTFSDVRADHSEYDLPSEETIEAAYTAAKIALQDDNGNMSKPDLLNSIAKWLQSVFQTESEQNGDAETSTGGGQNQDQKADETAEGETETANTESADTEVSDDSGADSEKPVHNQEDLNGWNQARSIGTDFLKFHQGDLTYTALTEKRPELSHPSSETITAVVEDAEPDSDDATRVEWINEIARWAKDHDWSSTTETQQEEPAEVSAEESAEELDEVGQESEDTDTPDSSDSEPEPRSAEPATSSTRRIEEGTVLSSESTDDDSGVDERTNGSESAVEQAPENGQEATETPSIDRDVESAERRRAREVARKLFTVFVKSGTHTYTDLQDEVDDLRLPPRTEALMATANSKGGSEEERIEHLTETVLDWQREGAEEEWSGTPYAPNRTPARQSPR